MPYDWLLSFHELVTRGLMMNYPLILAAHRCHLEVYFGVPASGFVPHTLNSRLHGDELAS